MVLERCFGNHMYGSQGRGLSADKAVVTCQWPLEREPEALTVSRSPRLPPALAGSITASEEPVVRPFTSVSLA